LPFFFFSILLTVLSLSSSFAFLSFSIRLSLSQNLNDLLLDTAMCVLHTHATQQQNNPSRQQTEEQRTKQKRQEKNIENRKENIFMNITNKHKQQEHLMSEFFVVQHPPTPPSK
jgi:Zn-dependent metalloprotease